MGDSSPFHEAQATYPSLGGRNEGGRPTLASRGVGAWRGLAGPDDPRLALPARPHNPEAFTRLCFTWPAHTAVGWVGRGKPGQLARG